MDVKTTPKPLHIILFKCNIIITSQSPNKINNKPSKLTLETKTNCSCDNRATL